VFVSIELIKKSMDATHELSRNHEREGRLLEVVEPYRWAKMYIEAKDSVKMLMQ
jgi:hypothetical protein